MLLRSISISPYMFICQLYHILSSHKINRFVSPNIYYSKAPFRVVGSILNPNFFSSFSREWRKWGENSLLFTFCSLISGQTKTYSVNTWDNWAHSLEFIQINTWIQNTQEEKLQNKQPIKHYNNVYFSSVERGFYLETS